MVPPMIVFADAFTCGRPMAKPWSVNAADSGIGNTGCGESPNTRPENHRLVGATRPSANRLGETFATSLVVIAARSAVMSGAGAAVVAAPDPDPDPVVDSVGPVLVQPATRATPATSRAGLTNRRRVVVVVVVREGVSGAEIVVRSLRLMVISSSWCRIGSRSDPVPGGGCPPATGAHGRASGALAEPAGHGLRHVGDDPVIGQVQGGLHRGADREQSGAVGQVVAVGADRGAGLTVLGAHLKLLHRGRDLLVVRQHDIHDGPGRDLRVVLGREQEVGLDVHRAGLLDGGDGRVRRHESALGVLDLLDLAGVGGGDDHGVVVLHL